MRRFPSSWKNTLAALGLRRGVKKTPARSHKQGMARFEQLERREVLSGAPLQATYEFVIDPEPDAYDPASQFTLTTEYVGAEATPRAVLGLRADLTEETRDIALQEIEVELRSGETVLQTQSILIDIAEAEFVNEFSGDRQAAVEEVLEDAIAVPPASHPGADIPLEELLDVAAFEAKRRSGEAGPEEATAYYSAFKLALEEASSQQESAQSAEEYEQAFRESEALASAGLLLTGRLRQDATNSDPGVSAAASAASEALGIYGGSFYTIFSGLGGTHEIAREENYGGAEAFVLAIVEEPVFEATDSLRVELGNQPAMVQAYVVDGSLPSLQFASLQTPVSVIKDTYVNSALPSTTYGSANPLVVEKSGIDDESHAIFSIDLDGVSSLLPSSAQIALQATQVSGTPTHEIQAHYDFWEVSANSEWDEATLDWNLYDSQLDSGFRTIGLGSEQTINATGSVDYDVTEAIQRALLAGDANADGLFDATAGGIRSDIEAAYLATRFPAQYAAEYAGNLDSLDTVADGGKDYLYRNDLNWDGVVSSSDFILAGKRLDVYGDFNLDGTVDGADYSIWQANYGIEATRFQDADANADGAVNAADYTAWNDGEAAASSSNPYDGTARAKSVTFRVVPVSGTSASYQATGGTGLIVDSTANRIVQTHAFSSRSGDNGWNVDYEVLHESGDDLTIEVWETPIIDGVEGIPSPIYSSGIISQSGGVNGRQSHPIPSSAINLDGVKEGDYRLEAKVISGSSSVVSSRYFEGGMFYDKDDALHLVGNELDNSVEINYSGAWLRIHTEVPSTFEQIQFGSGSPVPSHVYFQTGAGDDTIIWYGHSQVDASFNGGLGDDNYAIRGGTTGSQAVSIFDAGGFDTITAGGWVNDLDPGQVLDFRSDAPQTLTASGQFVLGVHLKMAGAIQFYDGPTGIAPSGPGYDGGPLVVDSLGNEFDGQLGEGEIELREALEIANRVPGAHEIQFADSLFINGPETILVGSDPRRPGVGNEFEILDELVINGPGSEWLTLDAEGNSRLFLVTAPTEIHGLTGKNGQVYGASNGGAIAVVDSQLLLNHTTWIGNGADGQLNSWSGGAGGAVHALRSDLTVLDSTFDDNTARWGGAIYARPDGGEEIVIAGSTLSNNNASVINGKGGKGSAINIYSFDANAGSTRIDSTTISGNHGHSGPAVYVQGHGYNSNLSVEIANSTLTNNASLVNNFPAAIWNGSAGVVTVANSIVAHNVDHLSGASESEYDTRGDITFSHSLVGFVAANSTTPVNNQDGNIVLSGSQTAGLLPLADYGGPVETHALRPDSRAIDSGDATLNPQIALWDQRGPRFLREIGDGLDIGAVESSVIETFASTANTVRVFGSDGDDVIFASAAGVYLDWQGGYAFPVTTGSQTDLTVEAGYGDDIVFVEASLVATTTLRGEEGADQLHGGGGTNNKLIGGEGSDTVHINQAAVFDEVFEGLGNDTYVFNTNAAGAVLLRSGDGETAEGADTLDFSALTAGVALDLTDSSPQSIDGFALLIEQSADDPQVENVIGTSSVDVITGNDLDNTLIGGDGDDTLNGGDGNDELVGEAGMDALNGGAGEDLLHGGDDADTLMGGPDNDQLVGGDGGDTLDGGDGVDAVSGGLGADVYEVVPTEDYQSDLLSDPDGTPAITDGITTNSAPTFGALPSQVTLTVGVPYELQLTADSGDLGESVTYSVDPGTLPTSATLSQDGLLTWTPTDTEIGTSRSVSFVATDTSSLPLTNTTSHTFVVSAASPPPLTDFYTHIYDYTSHSAISLFHIKPVSGETVVEARLADNPTSPWRELYRTTSSGENLRLDDFTNVFGNEVGRGSQMAFRAHYIEQATGEYSPYSYTTGYIPTGLAYSNNLVVLPNGDAHLTWSHGYPIEFWGQFVADSVDIYYLPLDSPTEDGYVYLATVNGSDYSYTDTRPTSQQGSHYLLRHVSDGVSTLRDWEQRPFDYGTSGPIVPWVDVLSFAPQDEQLDRLTPGVTTSAGGIFVGLSDNASDPIGPSTNSQLLSSTIVRSHTTGFNALSVSYTDKIELYSDTARHTLVPSDATAQVSTVNLGSGGMYFGSMLYGKTASTSLGDSSVYYHVYSDLTGETLTQSRKVTVASIDLDITGLEEVNEESTGAVIHLNNDFSKALVDNGKAVPDNRRDPASGVWEYDWSDTSRLIPATLSWNAQLHQHLPIAISYPEDVLVWDVTGTTPELIESDTPYYATADGLSLVIEGVGRSASWGANSIKASFIDPTYLTSVITTDEITYTVVDFTALVDGDRDGEFKADDSDDRSLSFWYNSDVDRVRGDDSTWPYGTLEADVLSDVPVSDYTSRVNGEQVYRDAGDGQIRSIADLEDFFALSLNVDPLLASAGGDVETRYYVTAADEDVETTDFVDPVINLYHGTDANDSFAHVFGPDREQLLGAFALATVTDDGQRYPSGEGDLSQHDIHGGRNAFIVEAAGDTTTTGDGNEITRIFEGEDVAFTVHAEVLIDGIVINTLATSVDISFRDSTAFYDRYTVNDESSTIPGSGPNDPKNPDGGPFSDYSKAAEQAEPGILGDSNDYLLFVHGWNMTPEWKRIFADTTMKRLYWQGYTGSMGAFDWPTFVDDLGAAPVPDYLAQTYNPSEFMAYRSAPALKQLLLDFNGEGTKPSIFAHSMGNVLVGEALRLWQSEGESGTAVDAYIGTQAAVHHEAYGEVTIDSVGTAGNLYAAFPPLSGPQSKTPLFAHSTDAANSWVNIYNPLDAALQSWGANNRVKSDSISFLTKSGQLWPYVYYDSTLQQYQRYDKGLLFHTKNRDLEMGTSGEDLADAYEILAFYSYSDPTAGELLSKPMGARIMEGRFTDINLNTLGYSSTMAGGTKFSNHSFQFFYDTATTSLYWEKIIESANLSTSAGGSQ